MATLSQNEITLLKNLKQQGMNKEQAFQELERARIGMQAEKVKSKALSMKIPGFESMQAPQQQRFQQIEQAQQPFQQPDPQQQLKEVQGLLKTNGAKEQARTMLDQKQGVAGLFQQQKEMTQQAGRGFQEAAKAGTEMVDIQRQLGEGQMSLEQAQQMGQKLPELSQKAFGTPTFGETREAEQMKARGDIIAAPETALEEIRSPETIQAQQQSMQQLETVKELPFSERTPEQREEVKESKRIDELAQLPQDPFELMIQASTDPRSVDDRTFELVIGRPRRPQEKENILQATGRGLQAGFNIAGEKFDSASENFEAGNTIEGLLDVGLGVVDAVLTTPISGATYATGHTANISGEEFVGNLTEQYNKLPDSAKEFIATQGENIQELAEENPIKAKSLQLLLEVAPFTKGAKLKPTSAQINKIKALSNEVGILATKGAKATGKALKKTGQVIAEKTPAVGKLAKAGVIKTGQAIKKVTPTAKKVKEVLGKGYDIATMKGVRKKAAENIVQSTQKMHPSDIKKFKKITGKSPGEWMTERKIINTRPTTVRKLAHKYLSTKNKLDEAVGKMKGTFRDKSIKDVLDESIKKARLDTSSELAWLKKFKKLHDTNGLTPSQINQTKRFFERNVKLGYKQDLTASSKVNRATNMDDRLRKFLLSKADDQGLPTMRKLNKEIQGNRFLMDSIAGKLQGQASNNLTSLTDYVLLSGGLDPASLSALGIKKTFGSETGKSLLAKALTPTKKIKDIKIDLKRIELKAKQKKFQESLKVKKQPIKKAPTKKGGKAKPMSRNIQNNISINKQAIRKTPKSPPQVQSKFRKEAPTAPKGAKLPKKPVRGEGFTLKEKQLLPPERTGQKPNKSIKYQLTKAKQLEEELKTLTIASSNYKKVKFNLKKASDELKNKTGKSYFEIVGSIKKRKADQVFIKDMQKAFPDVKTIDDAIEAEKLIAKTRKAGERITSDIKAGDKALANNIKFLVRGNNLKAVVNGDIETLRKILKSKIANSESKELRQLYKTVNEMSSEQFESVSNFLQPTKTPKSPLNKQSVKKKPSPKIPKELEPLAKEARKYETAEEFVESKERIYHGGNMDDIKDIQSSFSGRRNTEASDPIAMLGVNFSDKGTAKFFSDRGGGKILEASFIPKKTKMFKDDSQLLNKLIDQHKVSRGTDRLDQAKKIKDIAEKNEFLIDNQFDSSAAIDFVDDLVDKGYDSIRFKNTLDGGITTIPLKKEAIKTKQQLKDFYNKLK